ncbi:MAG: hypothetical protein WCH39_28840, partial [Schlesneria sp.]
MQYSDFLESLKSCRPDWYLTNWFSAVRIALGGWGLVPFCTAFAILLAPSVLLLIGSVYSGKFGLLVPVALSLCGFWTSSTTPTGVGLFANLIVAIFGLICAVALNDWLLAFSAFLPGLTWFGSCAILGITASYVMETLRVS